MRIALTGLPFSGKSTVFKALAGKKTQPKTSASGKIQLNLGTLELRDERLEKLARILNSEKITYPKLILVDLAYSGGAGPETIETGHLREFDALAVVIGVFLRQDPMKDLADIEAELILGDMQLIQNRIEKINKEKKAHPAKEEDLQLVLLKRCQKALEEETLPRDLKLTPQELKMLAGFQLLTLKPVIVVANISEEQLNRKEWVDLEKKAEAKNLKFLSLCAKLEAEIEELPEKERLGFLKQYGLAGLSRDRFIEICFQAQDQILFFTVVGREARAWPVLRGTTALGAAGCVHSDMERGFIRAEAINYRDFVECGSMALAREKGLLRLESKEYPVQDGDIINFKFSV
ncbi:MAG: DUF933 domain-containing protein [Candidatus Omnitrophica bacterium]|nr:DUF933 domain-containing protein [Candidatus Omnitrophota bacterium]